MGSRRNDSDDFLQFFIHMQQAIVVQSPKLVSALSLDAFARLVLEGGEVQSVGLRERIERAYRLAFLNFGEQTVAIGAIKQPVLKYRNETFAKAALADIASEYEYELGWLYVSPRFRKNGLAAQIVGALVDTVENNGLYATSKEMNTNMHSVLLRNNFRHDGKSYESTLSQESVKLFLRNNSQRQAKEMKP